MLQPGNRTWLAAGAPAYKYGFNGKEKDNEIKGENNALDFGARIYDPRIGRWFSVDPMRQIYASLSPYTFGASNPVNIADKDGNILRDQYGNIIATPNGKIDDQNNMMVIGGPKELTKPGATQLVIKYKYITIYTDKGNPVTAQVMTGFVSRKLEANGKITEKPEKGAIIQGFDGGNIKVAANDGKANCHGYAFADNNIMIGDGRKNILVDEYEPVGVLGEDATQNKEMEKQSSVIMIYGGGKPFTTMDEMDESGWFHAAKKQKNGKWTDKDSYTPVRKDLTPEQVENSPLKGSGEKDIVLFKRKNQSDKKVTVPLKPKEQLPANKIRMVTEADMQKIKAKLNTSTGG
jgi:RHS repeat-associated protein